MECCAAERDVMGLSIEASCTKDESVAASQRLKGALGAKAEGWRESKLLSEANCPINGKIEVEREGIQISRLFLFNIVYCCQFGFFLILLNLLRICINL